MTWWFSDGSNGSTYAGENLAQTLLRLMLNECVRWHVRNSCSEDTSNSRSHVRLCATTQSKCDWPLSFSPPSNLSASFTFPCPLVCPPVRLYPIFSPVVIGRAASPQGEGIQRWREGGRCNWEGPACVPPSIKGPIAENVCLESFITCNAKS